MIRLIQGEKKTIPFAVKDEDGDAVNLTGATITAEIKRGKEDSTAVLSVADGDVDKTDQATGEISFIVDGDGLNGRYYLLLDIVFDADSRDRSIHDIEFTPWAETA